jgi:hypothetical protein
MASHRGRKIVSGAELNDPNEFDVLLGFHAFYPLISRN